MFFSSFLIALAITWLVAVVDTVIESAKVGAEAIVMFDSEIWIPPSTEVGILFLCALSATAAFAVVTAIAMARGRRLRKRTAAELSARIEELQRTQIGPAGLATLLPSRVAELQSSVETLTARRDDLLDEIAEIEERRARSSAPNVVTLPEPEPVVDVAATESGSDESEPAGTA